ncbi:MAG: ABC transporter permease [Lachnospiraceae bacterium]|nr:ABC transporter permease [Lachnospiraceae bacterium]
MKRYVIKRLISLIPMLLVLSFFSFLLLDMAPGDPAEKKLAAQGIAVTKEVLDAERIRMGLDRPFLTRYLSWLAGAVRGNLGVSYKDGFPVMGKLLEGLGKTCYLAFFSMLLSLIVAVPVSVVSAVRQNSVFDNVFRVFSFGGNSIPNFLISVLLMYVFCIRIKMFPVLAGDSFSGLFLPVISLAIPMAGRFIRQFRAELISQLEQDYVTGIRARGVRESIVLFRNVLYNALGHMITIVGLSVGTLMGGSVVIETIFRWSGIGKLVMDSITARDYPVVQGFVLVMGFLYLIIGLLTDLIFVTIDPRTEINS